MKWILFFLLMTIGWELQAQDSSKVSNDFIRIYDLEGKKIGSGFVQSFTDSSMIIKKQEMTFLFLFENIGTIKTQRSAGNNILIGAVFGMVTLGVLGWVAGEKAGPPIKTDLGTFTQEDTRPRNAVLGALAGAVIGGLGGAVSLINRKSQEFEIGGEIEGWNAFKAGMTINGS